MDNGQDLLNRHQAGLKGIFNQYTRKKFYRSKYFLFSFFLSLLLVIVLAFVKRDEAHVYMLVGDLTSVVLTAFPSLLGFSLAGYALIIGAINIGVLNRMSQPDDRMDRMSYFQFVSSVFALSVLVQCITMLFAFIVHAVIKQEWEMVAGISTYWINLPIYFILLFLIIESLVILGNTVVNIFSFAQSLHFCVRKEIEIPDEEPGIWDEIKTCIYNIVNKLSKKS